MMLTSSSSLRERPNSASTAARVCGFSSRALLINTLDISRLSMNPSNVILPCCPYSRADLRSPLLFCFDILPNPFALAKDLTLLFSNNSTVFDKNTGRWCAGMGHDCSGEPRNPVIHRSHCGGPLLVPQLAIARHKRWLYGKQLRSSRCLRLGSGRFLATAKRTWFLATAKRIWFLVTAKRSTGTVRGCSPVASRAWVHRSKVRAF